MLSNFGTLEFFKTLARSEFFQTLTHSIFFQTLGRSVFVQTLVTQRILSNLGHTAYSFKLCHTLYSFKLGSYSVFFLTLAPVVIFQIWHAAYMLRIDFFILRTEMVLEQMRRVQTMFLQIAYSFDIEIFCNMFRLYFFILWRV